MGTEATVHSTLSDDHAIEVSNFRAQLKSTYRDSNSDPFEAEAEELSEWLARREPQAPYKHPTASPTIRSTSHTSKKKWGTPLSNKAYRTVRKSQGKPLPADVRQDFESRLGRDLSDIRIHENPTARQLTKKIGAHAFAAGTDIFVAKPHDQSMQSRKLIAHEVIHTIQQKNNPSSQRIQCAFSHIASEIDKKVDILLQKHLKDKKNTKYTTIATDLKKSGSWFSKMRAKVERKAAADPMPTVDEKSLAEQALEQIKKYKNTDKRSSVTNSVASVVADYFRINNAWTAASLILVKYPYTMTVRRSLVVGANLDKTSGYTSAALAAIDSAWDNSKPKATPKVEAKWTAEISNTIDEFLSLAPIKKYETARNKLLKRLELPLREIATDLPDAQYDNFQELDKDDKRELNELLAPGKRVLQDMRELAALQLKGHIQAAAKKTDISPYEKWRRSADDMLAFADKLGTSKDQLLSELRKNTKDKKSDKDARAIWKSRLRVAIRAEKKLSKVLKPKVEKHVAFWERIGRIARSKLDLTNDADLLPRVQARGIDESLLHEKDQEVLKSFSKLTPKLATAFDAYLNLRSDQKINDANRNDPLHAFSDHYAKAGTFLTVINTKLVPQLTATFAAARAANDKEKTDRFGWFIQELQAVANTLEKIENFTLSDEKDVRRHDQKRDAIAGHLLRLARSALTKTTDTSGTTVQRLPTKDIAEGTAWEKIEKSVDKLRHLKYLKTSLLFVPAPFTRSSDSTPKRIAEDGGATRVYGIGPFNAQQLAELYQKKYYERVQTHLLEGIRTARIGLAKGGKRTTEDLWLVGNAIKQEADATPGIVQPVRYESRGVLWNRYAGDKGPVFEKLLLQSEQFRKWDAQWRTEFAGHDFSRFNSHDGPNSDRTIWIWLLPKPVELAKRIFEVPLVRGIDSLSDEDFNKEQAALDSIGDRAIAKLSAKATTAQKSAARLKATGKRYNKFVKNMTTAGGKLKAPSDAKVWERLQVAEKRSKALKEAVGRSFLRGGTVASHHKSTFAPESRAEMEKAEEALHTQMRIATTMDRAVVRAETLEILKAVKKGKIHPANGAQYVINNLAAFSRSVGPRDVRERNLQTAALVVEMMDELIALFTDARMTYSYKNASYYYLKLAHKLLDVLTEAPPKTKKKTKLKLSEHAQWILWNTEAERQIAAVWTKGRIKRITPVLDTLMADVLDLQWRLSISGESGGGGALISNVMRAPSKIDAAPAIQARNKGKAEEDQENDFINLGGSLRIRIAKVHTNFTYLPGYGDRARARNKDDAAFARYSVGRVYLGKTPTSRAGLGGMKLLAEQDPTSIPPVAKGASKTPLVDIDVLQDKKVIKTFTIHANDLGTSRAGLNWLASTVHGEAAGKSYRALGAVIEGFGEAMLFIASFYPPAALAMAAADILSFWAKIKTDKEFREQLTRIVNEPKETLEHFTTELFKRFSITGLFDMLMNGNFDAPDFASKSPNRNKRKPMGGKKVGKVFTRIKRVAGVMSVRLEDFQDSVQGPVHRVEGVMAKAPKLAGVTNWAGENAKYLSDPLSLILRHKIAGPIYEAYALYRLLGKNVGDFGAMANSVQNVATGIEGGLEKMKTFELPKTIMPLPVVIDAIIELLLVLARKTKGRAKIVAFLAEILKEGADRSGVTQHLLKAVSSMIEDTWADPNTYWRDNVVNRLKAPVENTIQSSGDGISKLLLQVPMLGDYFGSDGFKGEAKALPATVKAPKGDPSGVEVNSDEAHDNLFEDPRVQSRVPEATFEGVTDPISYSQISSLPDIIQMDVAKAANQPNNGGAQNASPLMAAPGDPNNSSSQSQQSSIHSSITNGDALPPATRSSAESRFGHSFSDVRLHRGGDAAALTQMNQAHALTSGSHIFMRPGLSEHSTFGRQVLDHELSHVLQKRAGAADPSIRNSATSGLRLRGDEERSANSMADRARRNHSGRPVPVSGAHDGGASPATHAELIETFIQRISSSAGPVSLSEAVEKAHARKKNADLEANPQQAATKLWQIIKGKIDSKGFTVPAHFGSSSGTERIKAHLLNRLETLIEKKSASAKSVPNTSRVIDHLAARRQEDVPSKGKKKKKSASTATAKPKQMLDAHGFLNDLALYIGARSGIIFEFTGAKSISDTLFKKPGTSVRLILEVKHVELYFVNDRATHGLDIWNTAINNTWTSATNPDSYRAGIKGVLKQRFRSDPPATATTAGATGAASSGGTGSTSTASSTDTLAEAGLNDIWDRSATNLKFSKEFEQEVETYLNPPQLDYNLLPPWPVYVGVRGKVGTKTIGSDRYKNKRDKASLTQAANDLKGVPGFSKNEVRNRSAQIGLHLSTHGEFTGGDWNLDPNKRNSHHIVQYLLPEYFANKKEFLKPFPYKGETSNPPGVESNTDGTIKHIENTAKGNKIEVAKTEKGRGGIMPAILISAQTHQNSGLHVTPKPDDKKKASQGYAIHHNFQKNLKTHNKKTGNARLNAAISDTYNWIWNNEMKDPLLKDFPGDEADYYLQQFRDKKPDGGGATPTTRKDALAKLHGGTAPTQTEVKEGIEKVVKEAETFAIKTLKNEGWELP